MKLFSRQNGDPTLTTNKISSSEMQIYLPKGHLKQDPNDKNSGENIWNYTNLPYPENNEVLELGRQDLSERGYEPDRALEVLKLLVTSPEDVPKFVKKHKGMGFTGFDWIAEELEIPVLNGHRNDYEFYKESLRRNEIYFLFDLSYKPVVVSYGFLKELGIRDYRDIKYFADKRKITIASVLPFLAGEGLKNISGLSKDQFEIDGTRGQNEAQVGSGNYLGMFEVVESGGSAKKAKIHPIFPPAIETTPHLITNKRNTILFPNIVSDISKRLQEGVDKEKTNDPNFFEKKFDPSIFDEQAVV